MLVSEAKALARSYLGFESYDTEPSALLTFIQQGVRVVGQLLLDANPWLFGASAVIEVSAAGRNFELEPTNYPALAAVPAKILTVGQASHGGSRYQWVPALQPVEVFSFSPSSGGYSEPYVNGWAYMAPLLVFNRDIPAGQDLLVMYAYPDPVPTADTDQVFTVRYNALGIYDYLVPEYAAILMAIQRGENPQALIALYQSNLRRVLATVQQQQVQALQHIPQFGDKVEP